MNSPALRVILGIVAVVLLFLLAGVAAWWKISHLKSQLVDALGQSIGATVEVSSLDFNLLNGEMHAAGITLTNTRTSAPWDRGSISQVMVKFHLADLLSSSIPVTVDVSTWNIVFHAPAASVSGPGTAPDPAANAVGASDGSNSRVRVTQLTAQSGSAEFDLADQRKVLVQGIAFDAADNGAGVWTTHLQAGSTTFDTLAAGSSSVDLRSDSGEVTFSGLHVQVDPGAITGDGQLSLGGPMALKINLKGVDLPMTMLVAAEWKMKLSGLVSGDLHYAGDGAGGTAQGHVVVDHAKLNALPMLGQVSTLLGFQDISNVELDEALSDILWKNGAIELSNLDIRKNGVLRLAGKVDIDPASQVDGQLRLGLPTSISSKWPQMRDQVFPVQWEDYSWADLHLTGTPDHLQEDLTGRLATAAVGQGAGLLQQAAQKAAELINGSPAK
jgi:hypothetical protein